MSQDTFDRSLPFNESTRWFESRYDDPTFSLGEARVIMVDGHRRWMMALQHLRAFLVAETGRRKDRLRESLPVSFRRGERVERAWVSTRGAAWYLPYVDDFIATHTELGARLEATVQLTDDEFRAWWKAHDNFTAPHTIVANTMRIVNDMVGTEVFRAAGIDPHTARGWLQGASTLTLRAVFLRERS
jgi:hypothetical protein